MCSSMLEKSSEASSTRDFVREALFISLRPWPTVLLYAKFILHTRL